MIYKVKYLAYILGVKPHVLIKVANDIECYYYEKKEEKGVKNGEMEYRILHPSKNFLKIIQKRINKRILTKIIEPNKHLYGGVKGRDNITNAAKHKGKKHHFRTDIKAFFDSINNRQVYQMFIQLGFSADVSSLLTKLTTYKGRIPQGAPTSTSVANLVFLPIDHLLIKKFKKSNNQVYTRFVDDLCFSSSQSFKDFSLELIQIIKNHNFKISHKKTTYRSGPIELTGPIVKMNDLSPSQKDLQKLNQEDMTYKAREGLENYLVRVISH